MDNVSAVKEKADIVEFIKGYVPLNKAGNNFKGSCPFHKEKTPSFMVNQDLQIYKCFGCDKSGDVISFAMEIEGLEFYDALKFLADKYGVKLESSGNKIGSDKKAKLYEINDLAAKFYTKVLNEHKLGIPALEYLKNRNIASKTIKEFKMGFAPDVWSSVSKYLLSKGYSEQNLVDVGLSKRKKSGGVYDIYRNRIIFPLVDVSGNIVGFSGRALSSEMSPKYINSPQTEIFHKDQFLFGLNLSKVDIRKERIAIVTEGEFDMISPYQFGIKNIVASKGTALTSGQLKLLSRYTDVIILLFDSDFAGIKASLKGIGLAEESGLDVRIALIPKGFKDPDEAIQKSPELLKKSLEEAMLVGDFYLYYVSESFDLSNAYEKSKAVEFLVDRLRSTIDIVVRSEYIKKYSSFLDVSESVLLNKLNAVSGRNVDLHKEKVLEKVVTKGVSIPIHECELLSLLINCDESSFVEFSNKVNKDHFGNEYSANLFDVIVKERLSFINKKKDNPFDDDVKSFDFKALYDKLRAVIDSNDFLNSLFLVDQEVFDESALRSALLSAVERVQRTYLKRKSTYIANEIRKAEAISDVNRVKELSEEFKKLAKELL